MFKDIMQKISTPPRSAEASDGYESVPYSKSILKKIDKFLYTINDFPDHRSPGFHASSVYGLCDREEILKRQGFPIEKEIIESELRAKFLLGTHVHTMVQDSILGPAGLIIGAWECLGCSRLDPNTSAQRGIYKTYPTSPCECGDTRWGYIEPKMRIAVPGVPDEPEWNIVGATDGIDIDNAVLDIKTISAKGVPELYKAFGKAKLTKDWSTPDESLDYSVTSVRKYITQINLYMYGFNLNKGYLLYLPKDKLDIYKDWIQIPVERDDRIVEAMFTKINRIYDNVKNEKTTIKRICGTPHSYRAKKCAACHTCFSLGAD